MFMVPFYGWVQLPQGYRATSRRQFTFYHKSPEIPGTHLSNLRRMKTESTLEPPSSFGYGIPGLGIQCLNH